MSPDKFGVVKFFDGRVEDILWYMAYPDPRNYGERIDFNTESGEYIYTGDVEVFRDGRKIYSREFYDIRRRKRADIQEIVLIKYERKTAGFELLKSNLEGGDE